MIRHAPPILRPSQRLITWGLLVALGIPAISSLQAALGIQSLTGRLVPVVLAGAISGTLVAIGATRTFRVLGRVAAENQAVCGQCGHSLRSVPDPVCPECGTRWDWHGDRAWLRSFWLRFAAQNAPSGTQHDAEKHDIPWLRRIDAFQLATAGIVLLGAFVLVWVLAPSTMRMGLTVALIVTPPVLLRAGRLIAGGLICRRVAGSAWRTCTHCGTPRQSDAPCKRCGNPTPLEEVRRAWLQRCPANWHIERQAANLCDSHDAPLASGLARSRINDIAP